MKSFLLIDFGASRIKAGLLIDDNITDVCDYPSIPPFVNENKCYEVSCLEIKDKFLEIANTYYKKYPYEGILICSEMHGFIVVDEKNNPQSNYISWKSECSTIGNPSDFSRLTSEINNIFYLKTGMKPRACYPIFNLFSKMKREEIKGGKIISLPDWLACAGGKSLNLIHSTMAAGLGFYNIYEREWDSELANKMKYPVNFNKVVHNVEEGGYLNINGKETPIYTGVGDHQCAVLGAGNNENSISVNLGTGSQVAIVDLDNASCEKRPYFDGKNLSVITHIPSGRMLNCFIGFLNTINPEINFWEELDKISMQDIQNSDLSMDLSIFESAWNYNNGGSVSGIRENNFTIKNYLASLLKNYIIQYKNAIETLKPSDRYNQIILSGGIPAKLPLFKEYFSYIINKGNKEYIVTYNSQSYDETLNGLKIIGQKI